MGLGLWSFIMATVHGAGLMLWPALMPLCFPSGRAASDSDPLLAALLPAVLGVGVHTLAVVGVTATIAVVVYEWIGLEILRRAWINLDVIWMLALATAGLFLLAA